VVGAFAVVGTTVAFPAVSQADTFTFFSDHCTGLCGPQAGGFGTVTLTQAGANTVNVAVNMFSNTFVNTGLDATFAFDLVGNPIVTYSAVSTFFAPIPTSPTGATSIHMDGTGFFEYGLSCNDGVSGSSCGISTLSFTLTATGLTTASFLDFNTEGQIFAADILSSTTGKTGAVDVPGPILGAGLPGLVMACGGLFALARRRRQQRIA
jgi:hypothetical protein